MKIGVMITNGDQSHPPEKWAEQTAEQLVDVIQIESTSPFYAAATVAKDELKTKITAAMLPHHKQVQDHAWDVVCPKRNNDELDDEIGPAAIEASVVPYLDQAVEDVLKVTDGSAFAEHYRKPEVSAFVRNTIGSHFSTVAHIEHSWDIADKRKALGKSY